MSSTPCDQNVYSDTNILISTRLIADPARFFLVEVQVDYAQRRCCFLILSYNLDLTNRTATSNQTTWSGSSIGGIAISNFGKVLIATEPNANKLRSYLINSSTGALTEADSKVTENYPHQTLFFPDGQYALVINKASKSISTFLVDENSGILKSVSSVYVGSDPQDLIILKIAN
jgi:6-phosphogluconolactonase (cycloisomerase 2 family)